MGKGVSPAQGGPRAISETPGWDRPDGLGIRERRQWRTWQLVVVVVVALLAGMAIGHVGRDTSPAQAARPAFSLPAPRVPSTGGASAVGPAAEVPTSLVGGVTVLLPQVQRAGSGVTPSFLAQKPGWRVGWVFDCAAAPAGLASFEMYVTSAAGAPLVAEMGTAGSGTATGTATGLQRLRITSGARCVWAVKVTDGG